MKKRIVMFFAVAMAAMCVSAATWTDPDTGYTWTYRIDDDNYSVVIAPSPTGAVTIPSTLGGKPVTSIGASAFSGCSDLTSVTIPNSVTNIGTYAFRNCSCLTNVTIGTGVLTIGFNAFTECSGLTSIAIPDGVINIEQGAFSQCLSLVNVTIPNSVTDIGPYAFYECVLTNISVSSGNSVYKSVDGLLLSKDGKWLLKGVNRNVTIPDSVTSIGDYAFDNCTNLISVTIPDSVTSIGERAFSGCSGLTSLTMGCRVADIGTHAFFGCSGLTNVTIPDSVTSIGESAFSGCGGLEAMTLPFVGPCRGGSYNVFGYIFGKYSYAGGKRTRGDYYIPAKLRRLVITDETILGYQSFADCSGLTSVTIPDTVTSIGYYAFDGCSGLTSVTIPDSVTSIGNGAFEDCHGLTSVTIGNGVTSIGSFAFSGCSGLTSVTIPSNVTSINTWAFDDCGGLTEVHISDLAKWCGISFGDPGYFAPFPPYKLYLNGTLVTDLVIPDGVTCINRWAFSRCSSLSSVKISDSVTTIEGDAFFGCGALKSVIIPNSVTSIGGGAFSGCKGLEEMILPFVGSCRGNSGTKDSLFGYIFGTRSYTGGKEINQYYDVGSSISYFIPAKLKSVEITNETILGYGAFYGCNDLTNVTIPASVTQIGELAFSGCSLLAQITMPGWFEGTLPDGVFEGCPAGMRIEYNIFAVTFNANGDSIGGASRWVAKGNAIGTLPTPTRTGYTFAGWWTAACGGTQISASTVPVDNVMYYAHWTVNQYTVTFNANGGTGSKSGKQDYGSAIVAPTVTRTGYTFAGWQPTLLATVPANDVTYTAQWKVNQYTATFNANGGSGGTTKTQDYGTSLTAPSVTRTGYTLTGWSPSVPSTMPAESKTYTAQWQINQYTVTFNANGGTGGKTVTQNYATSLTAPTVTREGYTFTGWSPAVPSTVPAGNATYTAQWQINQYTVTFDGNGGALGERALPRVVTTQNYGTAIVAPTVTREWCTFAGWSPAVAATVPANNVTYTAQWRRWGDSISASKMGGKTMKQLYPSDYSHMTTVVLEESITELPEGFFDGCSEVVSVTWPSMLVEFGLDAVPPKIRATLAYDANGFMIYNGWILDYMYRNASVVTIPEGIVGIGRGVFAEMYDLETVTMPESLRCIAKGAFEGCTYIQDLQFMSGLRHVGPVAFRDCSSLLGVSFADGLVNIGTNAFEDCWQMRSVRLPYTVTNIGVSAFSGCSAIRGVTVPTHVKTMQELFPSYSQIETAEVAEGETVVMDDMFAGCVSLRGGATQTDMSMIPDSVTNIGARAFQNCRSLTAFVVPDSVFQIGVSVFQGCSSLWNVTLSRSLTEIPDYAFYGCSMLETMVVPASVTYLGDRFFSGRTSPIQGPVIENALYYLCTNAPSYHSSAYAAIAGNMTTYVLRDSRSWDGRQGSRVLPQSWNGYPITYWTPNRFDVTFDANGGQFDSSGGSTWSEQQITDTTYALPSTEPTRPGWAFEGWWTEQTGGAEVRYTTLVTATRTHTLYAHWRSLGNGMTVTFNSNGGTVVTPGTQTYVPGQTFGQFPVPTRRGYTFKGWWTEAVNGIRMTEATQVPAADMELFAHWSPISYYVRFNANGGVGSPVYQTFTFDVQQALATHTFTREGFVFSGWATTPSGQVRYPENKSVVNLEEVQDEVVDLYAVWSGVGYSVRFDSNGGTGIMDNQTIAVGETQNLWPCAFARSGYTFAGWAVSPTDAEAKKVTYLDGVAVRNLATSNGAVVPLYAVWVTGGQTVRITFDANGGSVAPNDYWDCVVGTAVEAFPTPTRPGFTFAGWWTAKTGGTQVSSIARVTSAQTLYAHWTSNGGVDPGDGSCTVTFNANGGSVTETERTVKVGTAVGTLPTPMRTNYKFVGWFTAAEGGVQVFATTKVSSSVEYYAHWTAVVVPPGPDPEPDPEPVYEVAFAVSEVAVTENANAVVHVMGGSPDTASSVKVYLTYNTATAADVNLGTMKFPVTLKWAKGDVGKKVITIPIKKDALVEGEEFFTLQLAAANGVERGAQTVCTVRITDAQWPDGMTPEEAAARGLAALPSGATAVKDAAGMLTGYFTKKDKKGNVTAKAMPGYIFTGWYDAKGKKVGAKAALADKTRKSKKATPKFAVAHYLRGLADPANGGKVTGSGKYAAGKKVTLKATPKKNWTFEGWRLMAPVAATSAAAPATGYVSKAKSLTVAVTNELTYLAMFKPYPKVTVAVDNAKGGTVKGAGSYKTGTAVTLKATPKKGYAFCGWFDADGTLVSLNANYKYKVTADGLSLSASFKKESALAKPVLTWNATNLTVGVNYSAKLSVVGESLVSVTKVTGLPKGLAFKSGKVSGVPTVAKAVTAKVTVSLKSNAKKTWTYSVKLNVSALPTWAVGTFKGKGTFGGKVADVTLTVGKTGKISGKFVAAGKQYPFTASSFAELDAQGVLRTAKGTLKYGTKSCKVEIAVAEGEGGGEAEVAVTGGVTASGALAVP